jgi:uncharacterized membrane protein YphA (DoxX/SURF4 family)
MTRPGREGIPDDQPRARGGPRPTRPSSGQSANPSASSLRTWPVQILERFGSITEAWGPTAARLLLGLVLLWFGYHELVQPGLWTGYVPVLSATSHAAQVLVLAHGWLLLVLAVALLGGVAPRLAAGIAAVLLLEIVISLGVQGLSDLVLRDVGVFGLSLGVAGATRHRLLLRR